MNFQTILYEKRDNIAKITLNRPEKRNALSRQMINEIDEAFKDAEKDDEVRVVILAAAGPVFIPGHDLRDDPEQEEAYQTVEALEILEQEQYLKKSLYIRDFRKPTIAQVQGYCMGAGIMMISMFDLITASEKALFSNPLCRIGLASAEMPVEAWEFGIRKAKEFLFTGDTMDAQEAWRLGLVNRVFPADELEKKTMNLAKKIALMPPVAVRAIKASFNQTQDIMGWRESIPIHFYLHLMTHSSGQRKKLMETYGENFVEYFKKMDAAFRELD